MCNIIIFAMDKFILNSYVVKLMIMIYDVNCLSTILIRMQWGSYSQLSVNYTMVHILVKFYRYRIVNVKYFVGTHVILSCAY